MCIEDDGSFNVGGRDFADGEIQGDALAARYGDFQVGVCFGSAPPARHPHSVPSSAFSPRPIVANPEIGAEATPANIVDDAGLAVKIQYHLPVREYAHPSRMSYDLRSTWVAVARTPADLEVLGRSLRWRPLRPQPFLGVWSDDYSNIAMALMWKQFVARERWTR